MLSTKYFYYNPENKIFYADMSELQHRGFSFQRIYADACDEGFVLVSHRTGNESQWVVNEYMCDDDGDLRGWKLVPTANTIRRNRCLKDVSMIIYND